MLRSRASSCRQPRSSGVDRERGASGGPPNGGSSAGGGGGGGSNSGGSERDRDSFSRWRDRQYFGPRRWLESALRESSWDKDPGI